MHAPEPGSVVPNDSGIALYGGTNEISHGFDSARRWPCWPIAAAISIRPMECSTTTRRSVPPLGKLTHRNNLPPAKMLMEPGPGVGGPGPGVMAAAEPATSPGGMRSTSQVAFVSPEGMSVAWDVGAPGSFDSEPLIVPGRYNFPQGSDLSPEADQHSGSPGRRAVSDARSRSADAAHRSLPGAQRHSGAVHRRRLRPGAVGQLRHQGHLPARSRVPGAGAGRRRDAGQHAARSGRRSDRRSRSPRRDPGDRSRGQQGFGSARRRSRVRRRHGRRHGGGCCPGGFAGGPGGVRLRRRRCASPESPARCLPARPRRSSPA